MISRPAMLAVLLLRISTVDVRGGNGGNDVNGGSAANPPLFDGMIRRNRGALRMANLSLEAFDEEEPFIQAPTNGATVDSENVLFLVAVLTNRLDHVPAVSYRLEGAHTHTWITKGYSVGRTGEIGHSRGNLDFESNPIGAYLITVCSSAFVCSAPVSFLFLGGPDRRTDPSTPIKIALMAEATMGTSRGLSESAQLEVIESVAGPIRPWMVVLELGCGTLRLAERLVPLLDVGHYLCLDPQGWVLESTLVTR